MAPKPSTELLAGVAVGLLVGLVLASGAPAGSFATPNDGDDDRDDTPGYTLSSAGPSCYEGPTANAGWVHEVANGDYYGVTLNATVVHDTDRRVSVNVTERTPGTYELAIVTTPPDADEDDRMAESLSNCDRAETTLDLATGLPTEYERAVVTVDDRELLTFENADTTADLYRLPNPVNATAAS
ncbi:hypothetical protein [Halogeometricum limi]|uniref:Uncharacterized protein n=1 Tax=Halogeometricum limi TaxID=555875 RepID=A0A1I6HU65_9EURY|nr:hypothetical protein [Halogeometricum limi]SFR58002.1 hypothetical protein SAMN04488124_2463 [Halogeometricum limi]